MGGQAGVQVDVIHTPLYAVTVGAQHGAVTSSRASCTALCGGGRVQQDSMPSSVGVTGSEEGCPARQILGRQFWVMRGEASGTI